MKAFCGIIIFLLCLAMGSAFSVAQGDFVMGEILEEAQCFNVVNKAPYRVHGRIMTDAYIRPDGIKAHHRSNFRLSEGERVEFCTSGPFFDGRTVDFTLRTLVPIFYCRTAITGDIVIYGRKKRDGGTETYAECL